MLQTGLTIAIIIVCVLLIIVVLIQNSKGGGISSNFGAANQIMGARRGTDVIEKTTWTLAILLLVLSLLSAPKSGGSDTADAGSENSKTKSFANPENGASGAPVGAPMQAPATATPGK